MPVGQPAEEVIDVYNELAAISPAEVEAIGQLEWRLQRLSRARAGDLAIRVARLLALQLLGKAGDAIPIAEGLWDRRALLEPQVLGTLAAELMHLGMTERVLSLADEIGAGSLPTPPTAWKDAETTACWQIGDVPRMITTLNPGIDTRWIAYLRALQDTGFAEHLPARQRIVREKVFGRQSMTELHLLPGNGQSLTMAWHIFIASDYDDRIALEEDINRELEAYFGNVNYPNHWEVASEMILPMSAAQRWIPQRFPQAA